MSEYTPDSWVVLKIVNESETLYKVLAGWSGGYLDGDSWRLNSGIVAVEKQAYLYGFYGSSGSVYWCHQGAYRLTMATSGVYNSLIEKFGDAVEMMPEDTDWDEVEWGEVLKAVYLRNRNYSKEELYSSLKMTSLSAWNFFMREKGL